MNNSSETAELTSGRREAALAASASLGLTASSTEACVAASRGLIVQLGLTVFLSMLPVTMLVPVLRELVAERFGGSTGWAHAFMSINLVGGLLAAPLGAWLGDRCNARRAVAAGALALDGVMLALMYAAARWQPSLGVLMALRFVEGAAHVTAISALMALAGDWADPQQRGRVMGAVGASLMFGTAIGTPLGGRLGKTNADAVLLVGAVLCAAALAMCLRLREPPRHRQPTTMRETLLTLRSFPRLWVPYVYAFIDRFCVGVLISTFILYLGNVMAMTPERIGGLMAAFLLPFAALCYPAGRLTDRFGRALPMCAGSLLFGVVYAGYGMVSQSGLLVLMLLSGLFSAMMFAPNLAMCSDLAPPGHRAAAFAGFNMAGSLGFLCGPVLGGVLLAWFSPRMPEVSAYRTTFVVTGMTEVLCAIVSIPWLLALRRKGLTR